MSALNAYPPDGWDIMPEKAVKGVRFEYKWSESPPEVLSVCLEYSYDVGKSWTYIGFMFNPNNSQNVGVGAGSYNTFLVPADSTETCLMIRVSCVINGGLDPTSDDQWLMSPVIPIVDPNSAPTTPSSITLPSSIKSEETFTISWGTSTDVEDNLEGYILERSTNGGTTWTEIYNGPSTTTTNLVTYGLTSVMYRVKAYDSEGAESEYQSSSLVSVVNNTAPKISGSDSSLGTKVFAFTQSYTVTDDEGGTVTVVEKVDGVTYKSYTVTLGSSNVFTFTDSQWQKLANGSHSMTVTATDSYGASATRTYTFTKSETEIELTYTTAITATTMPTVGVYYMTKEIPSGASFSVRVCNNGFDSSPTWEDVTSAVNNGGRFYFNNTSKTASKWGVNAEIKVSRNNASGDCYISSVRGYFK